MRLIDADTLLSKMSARYDEKKSIVADSLAEGFMQMEKLIKEQPTAYDIDKVVEELFDDDFVRFDDDFVIPRDRAIEIVKQGKDQK